MESSQPKEKKVKKRPPPTRYFSKSNVDKETHEDGPKSEKDEKQRQHNKRKDRHLMFKNIKKQAKIRKQGYEVEKYKTKEGKEESQQVFNIDMMRRSHPQKRFKAKDNREKGKPKNLTSRQKLNKQGMEKSYQVDKMERDPYPGDKPIPQEHIQKYERGTAMKSKKMRSEFATDMTKKKEKKLSLAAKQTARTELLMQENEGFLEVEGNEETANISQHDIAEVVDVTSAQKYFDLKLKDFGPYRINYTRNGRFLLMGGAKGHVAAIDWMTKKLLCEMNVMETVSDVRWLHQETMYAVAQKQWTYIYDNQGIELHCLKILDSVLRMEFLPYHFLLATANSKGYLSYVDVSIGEKVAGYGTGLGRLDVMCQNPANAIVALGHSGGTVTQWCPKMKEPVVKMLCHNSGVRSVTIDKSGLYMATSGIDRTLKIWDMRTYKMLQSYKVPSGAAQLSFSQKGLLASCMGNIVQVYNDCCRQKVTSPYLVHDVHASVHSLQFCPYEDVLGVGHADGFSSLIVPGAGEPNFDALETNPYQTKKQRQEAEVKMLLDK
ncbi:WD repeat-containing protein 46-like, partial [Ruditapes philippinarum]|uniref:WD repeat-containing protein 46-like n=1 Tax=Ruditapes philippinarum TaxID=129788 RepID=UPI00295B2867